MAPSFKKRARLREKIVFVGGWNEFKVAWADRVHKRQLAAMEGTPPVEYSWPRRFIFRGQSDKSWGLTASFDREVGERKDIEGVYHRYLIQFDDWVRDIGYLEPDLHDPSLKERSVADTIHEFRLAAVGQHRGLPTRMLDWTSSPYVAAFFAFVGCRDNKGNVAVWCLDVASARGCIRPQNLLIEERIARKNFRQISQSGAFTLNSTKLSDLDRIFEYDGPYIETPVSFPILFRLEIPASERASALKDLELMRINYRSLFPDLEGLIFDMRERLRSGGY